MVKNDDNLFRPGDIPLALSLLSRLPVRINSYDRTAQAAWAYPIAGMAIGGLAALSGCFALLIGLPAMIAALICLATQVIATGALHEDGLADMADGFWGGWDKSRRLEIMKDSRIGAYGVIALVLSLLARWAALWVVFDTSAYAAFWPVVAIAALSRAGMPLVMISLPTASTSGLAHSVGTIAKPTALSALAIGSLVMLLLTGATVFPALIFGGLMLALLIAVSRIKIGGYTGDILGASQQLLEITLLFCLIS